MSEMSDGMKLILRDRCPMCDVSKSEIASLRESLAEYENLPSGMRAAKLNVDNESLRESLKLAVEALELAEHRLHESINGQFRKFYDEADKDMRLAKSIIDHSLAKIKDKGGL